MPKIGVINYSIASGEATIKMDADFDDAEWIMRANILSDIICEAAEAYDKLLDKKTPRRKGK